MISSLDFAELPQFPEFQGWIFHNIMFDASNPDPKWFVQVDQAHAIHQGLALESDGALTRSGEGFDAFNAFGKCCCDFIRNVNPAADWSARDRGIELFGYSSVEPMMRAVIGIFVILAQSSAPQTRDDVEEVLRAFVPGAPKVPTAAEVTLTPHTLIELNDEDNEAFQERMHSDDAKFIVTCGNYPSVFHDACYPDFMVVWDHGEGPHNPEAFESVSQVPSEENSWYFHNVYPQWVWDIAREVLESKGIADKYVVLWFRGAER